MAEKHTGDIDCGKCKAVFKKEQDVFDHSNDCSEVLQMNICEFCRQEVVSKLALKKHMKTCKKQKLNVPCRNGQLCSYFKANKCNFFHPVTHNMQSQSTQNQNQKWHTVQKKSRKVLWTCCFCTAQIHSQEAGRNHICEMHPGKVWMSNLGRRGIMGCQTRSHKKAIW